jgi:hypothetical protein
MDHRRVAPLVGIGGCLAVLAALAYPLLLEGGAGTYYGSGSVNPLVAGVLALVTIIVFAAGREDRTAPDFAAGVTLVFGLATLLIVALWATSVRVDAVAIDPNHRWVVTGLAVTIPAAAAWYARSLGLV